MAATIINKGTIGGPSLAPEQGYGPSWIDAQKWYVGGTGITTVYSAICALNTAGNGYGGAHPTMTGLVGLKVSLAEELGPDSSGNGQYMLRVDYGHPTATTLLNPSLDPTARPPLVQWKFALVTEPCDTDNAGNRIVNSAGDIFDPPQTIERVAIFITELKYLSTWVASTAATYINCVNSASVALTGLGTIPARSLRVVNLAPMGEFYLTATPLPVILEMEYRPQTFDRWLRDVGYRAWWWTGSGAQKLGKLLMKKTKSPPPQPILLDGGGIPVETSGYTIEDTDWATATSAFTEVGTSQLPSYMLTGGVINSANAMTGGGYRLPYRIYNEVDFSGLATLGF